MRHRIHRPPAHSRRMGLLLGGGLIIMGTALLLSRLGVLGDFDPWQFWPLLLVLAGILKLFGHEEPPGRAWGLTLVGAGVLLQLHYLEVLTLQWKLVWPVLLIVCGLMVLGSSFYRTRRRRGAATSGPLLDIFVVLGGKEDRIESKDFEGGEIFCLMGGCELDLRETRIRDDLDEAVLNVRSIMGGVELRVPEDWNVIVRGTPIMGSFEDKTRPRRDARAEGKKLVISGTVVMGGVEIKN